MNVYPRKCSTLPAFPGNDYKSQCVVDMLYAVGDDDAGLRVDLAEDAAAVGIDMLTAVVLPNLT